jgi:predicted permease
VLIRPLPYPESERIVTIRQHAPGLDLPELQNSRGLAPFYREVPRSVRDFSLVDNGPRNVTSLDRPERIDVARASPSLFDVLGVEPALGRRFTPDEERPERGHVVLLSHGAWTSWFGRDPAVLGRTLELDGTAHEVVGVMPAGFAYPEPETKAWVPMTLAGDEPFGTFGTGAVARLAPGFELADAVTEIEQIQVRIPEYFPDDLTPEFFEMARWGVTVETLREQTVGDVRTALLVVLGTVGFVLLIACANVANLFLVRAEARQREASIRRALGAGRLRLALGWLSESLLLGLAAGAVGLGLAAVGVKVLVATGPEELPRLSEVVVGGRTLLFTLLVSIGASLAFGSLPALRYLRGSGAQALGQGNRSATAGRERHRARNVLVVAQLALALVLLVGSGLMLRSFASLRAVDTGVEPEGVLVVGLSVGEGRERAEAASFYQQVVDQARGLPGAVEVGVANSVPLLAAGANGGSFAIQSRPRQDDELPPVAMNVVVAGDAFGALGIPVVRGRGPAPADHEGGPPVAWVNETFARTFLPDSDPLTEQLAFNDSGPFMRIAGVVGDTRHFGLDEDVGPLIYVPMTGPGESRGHIGGMILILETDLANPTSLVPAVRALVARIDGSVPVTTSRTMEKVVAASMSDTSFTMVLLGIASLVALVLGAVGIFGVITYVVSQRTKEIGVRMALGADRATVRTMVVRQGMVVAALGIALGLLGSYALTGLMTGLLHGVSPTDPLTFGAVTAGLAAVAAVASYLPARRASKVDPCDALRAE